MKTDAFRWKDYPRTTGLNSSVPLALGYSVKIRPGGHLTIPLECTRPVTDRKDIRMDIGFHHRKPYVCIPPPPVL